MQRRQVLLQTWRQVGGTKKNPQQIIVIFQHRAGSPEIDSFAASRNTKDFDGLALTRREQRAPIMPTIIRPEAVAILMFAASAAVVAAIALSF
jgi:hypothetical protein